MAFSGVSSKRHRVGIVGAGVCGLSTAVVLAESLSASQIDTVDITIVADRFTPNTCSDGAAGLWRPFFLNSTPREKQE